MDRRHRSIRCSFCGETGDRTRRIIAGPGVYICAQCVHLCTEILEEDPPSPSQLEPRSPSRRRESVLSRLARHARGLGRRGLGRRLRFWRPRLDQLGA